MLKLRRNTQRYCLLITAGITCIAILISLQPRLLNLHGHFRARPTTRIEGDYQAPLHLCDSPARIPHEYIVFLRLGYTLKEHKLIIGEGADLDSIIIFPEEGMHPLYYAATLQNASLTAVRADVGVDLVECNRELFEIG